MPGLSDSYYTLRVDVESLATLPLFPAHLLDPPDDSVLSRLYRTRTEPSDAGLLIELSWDSGDEPIELGLQEASGASLALGYDGVTALTLLAEIEDDDQSFTVGGGFSLSFDSGLIQPVELVDGQYRVIDGEPYRVGFSVDLTIGSVGISVGGPGSFAFPPFAIGATGIVVDPGEVRLAFSPEAAEQLAADFPAAGLDAAFRGVWIAAGTLYFPAGFPVASVEIANAFIGTNGFSGSVTATARDPGLVAGAGLSGLPFTLSEVELAFVQNSLTAFRIDGALTLPFFDEPLDVTVGLGMDGGLIVGLAQDAADGLAELELGELGTITLSGLGFVEDASGAAVLLSGTLQLSVLSPALQWPTVELQGLRISAAGEVELPDGWLDLQTPVALDLYGFILEISRIGFGSTDDGLRWVGFSAGVRLVDFLPTGVSVEGLRVTWDPTGVRPPRVTLQGVGLQLTLPGVLTLQGDVAFVDEEAERYFKGNADLALLPLGIRLDASLKIGRNLEQDYKFVYAYLDLTLPVGLPLFATGAALYGFSGLYGVNVGPSAQDGDWYGWYAGPPAPLDVTHSDKWISAADGNAVGAGMTLGTLFDLGRAVSVKSLFALVLPGPVILLQGKANFLQTPPDPEDPTSEGVLSAFAVLDTTAGSLQLAIDAGWSLGQVVDIAATADAYFEFPDPRNWHLYLGQDQPEDRRIRASLLALLHGDAYLMIDGEGIATGAAISWGDEWKFGPVVVTLRAWIGAQAAIEWQPAQLEGSLNLGGEFAISVAGFGAGLSVEALLAAKAPTLYWVRGELGVVVKLPWPLDDIEESIVLEWREEATPPSEDPFESISLAHPKVDESWTGLPPTLQTGTPGSDAFESGPIVPLDARPSIAFDRGMKDLTGGQFASVDAYGGSTRVGDHEFDYELLEVSLEKWPKAGGAAWIPVEDLYGAWMAVEGGSGEPAFSRLQVLAKSPFAFTRQTSRTYRDAFLANHAAWPCVQPPEVVTHCVDWDGLKRGAKTGPSFEHGGLRFALVLSDSAEVVAAGDGSECGTRHALAIEDGAVVALWIVFPEPIHTVELCIDGSYLAARAFANGVPVAEEPTPAPGFLAFQADGIDSVVLFGSDNCRLARICYQTEALFTEYAATFEHNMSVYEGSQRWESADEVLEPETWYRLTLREQTARTHNGSREVTPYEHYAYFQTAGPPALTPAWALDPAADAEAAVEPAYPLGGRLTTLEPYISWTIPADGAAPVYRAYDLGAEFDENYVEQMVGADMAIRLTDPNAQPVLGDDGAELSFPNQWAEQPSAELAETEYAYATRVEACFGSTIGIAADQRIAFANGVLLDEDFSGDLAQWTDTRPAAGGGWAISEGKLVYEGAVIAALRALLVAGEIEWTDYAIEVTLTDEGDDVGLAWRYTEGEGESHYRLRLDPAGRYLERVVDGVVEVLWEDDLPYAPATGQTLGVHCQGSRLRGQLGGELLFELEDTAPLLGGQVGIDTGSTAAFERFLVRTWPGAALAPETQYRAELQASFVLHAGGLTVDGWVDPGFAWVQLERENAKIAALGRDVWTDYRLEVNAEAVGRQIGAIARFQQDEAAGTFTCYRLLVNLNQESVHLARLEGTFTGGTYALSGATTLLSCDGAACGLDFALDTHTVAFTCDGDLLVAEIDGVEVLRVNDPGGLGAGKAGLYHLGADQPVFTDLVVRSAPRGTVHAWSFATSRYAGLVEHLDTFTGQVHRETADGVDATQLANAIAVAATELDAAAGALADARALLAGAAPGDVPVRRDAAQAAARSLWNAASAHFDALHALLLGAAYRALPPVVELSEIVQGRRRPALLLESPEPLDWTRIDRRLTRQDPASGEDRPLPGAFLVWSDDGARALVLAGGAASLRAGEYELLLTYSLDIGLEAPLLRRGASTLPEVARLRFALA